MNDNVFSMIYPYYENPKMLNLQIQNWDSFSEQLKQKVRIVLIDDGSRRTPAYSVLKNHKTDVKLYRINENIPWNQHGARNLGAFVSCENDWLFMSDIDIVLSAETAEKLFSSNLNSLCHYTFERHWYINGALGRKVHENTFLVKRNLYWKTGGYDEDYCGVYGGDEPFLHSLRKVAPRLHRKDIVLDGYTRRTVVDACTTDWDRSLGRFLSIYKTKVSTNNIIPVNPLRFTWERII